MTEKIRKIFSLILALMLCVFVLAPSFAEETEEIPETELEEEFEEEEEEEEVVSFDDDDCGSADEETVAQNAPKMTEEIIQEDDWSDVVKARNETENERQAEVERQAQEEAKRLAEESADEAAEETAEEEAAEEETVKESAEETTEEPAEENAEESAEEAAEEPAEEKTEESAEEPTEEELTEPEEAEAEDEEEAEEDPDKITVKVEAAMVGENLMKLTAIVHGPEDRTYAFQWQMSEEKDCNYSDIEEATEQELLVELTEDNINSFWRVRVEAV